MSNSWQAIQASVESYRNDEGIYAAMVCGEKPYFSSPIIDIHTPIDQGVVAQIGIAGADHMESAVEKAQDCFKQWRLLPAPKRGELVRVMGQICREEKAQLAELITLEAGKITQEALGEVQEVIDVLDFAVGLSRQLYGLTIATERPDHRMMEQWHPLGVVGIITAFNFPMAVWAWNAALALVCGNALVWKPSEKTPLCALACHRIVQKALHQLGWVERYPALSSVVNGGATVGEVLARHPRVPLVSATGSVPMGKKVAQAVAARLGRSLLELGGNNAVIVSQHANLSLAVKACVFSAVGTTGQRCTSLRRLFVHREVYEPLKQAILKAYGTIVIGDPRSDNVLCGPLIDEGAFQRMQQALEQAQAQGGSVLWGGKRVAHDVPEGGVYVQPAIVEIRHDAPILTQETFAPLLYLIQYDDFDRVLAWHNDVPQGLSSAIFTDQVREAEVFLSASGSDCGIANVNIGTSGAEIGGAFGGEKETGGGRESGSDAWKNYMRRSTNTINYGTDLPLAQGIKFDAPE